MREWPSPRVARWKQAVGVFIGNETRAVDALLGMSEGYFLVPGYLVLGGFL